MPRNPSTAPLRATLAVALAAGAGAAAFAQTQNLDDQFGLRPTLSPAAKTSAQSSGASAGKAAGSGSAGTTGFVSTASGKSGPKTTASASEQPSAGKSASSDVTGTVSAQRIRPKPVEEDPYKPVGIRAGSFIVTSRADLVAGYDNNPFRVSGGRGSRLARASGEVIARSDWSRHELVSELRGAYIDYFQAPNNDRPEAEARLRGRIDVSSAGRIELEGRAGLLTEPAGSPDAVTSAKRPPHIYTFAGLAGYTHRFNRLELGLRGNVERSVYQDAQLISGGVQDLSDRDFTDYGVALRGSYEVTPGIKPFVEAGVDRRHFDYSVDFSGVRRGSRGAEIRGGLEFGREGLLTGSISAGYEWRRYRDATLPDISGLIVDSSLVWRASGLTTVTLTATSDVGETMVAGASGVFIRQAGLTIDHAFRRWLVGSASIAYGTDEYRGAGRTDRRLDLAASVTYYMNRYAALRGEVRRERLHSSVPGQDYTANIVLLGLRMQR